MNNYSYQYPPLTPINKYLIISLVGIFLLQSVLSLAGINWGTQIFALSSQGVLSGLIFQFITYPFISSGLFEVIINAFLLWMIGGEFEKTWGGRRYSMFLIFVTVFAGFCYFCFCLVFSSFSAFTLSGFVGVTNALLIAYAIIYPDRMFSFMLLFPVKAKYFCLILIGIQLYMGVFSPAFVLAWGHLGAMLAAVIYMVVISSNTFKGLLIARKKKSSAKLSLIKNDDERPKYWN